MKLIQKLAVLKANLFETLTWYTVKTAADLNGSNLIKKL